MFRILLVFITILAACLCGCAPSEFGGGTVKSILEGSPITLVNEQVLLNEVQLDCGTKNELWDPPSGNMARLTQKAKDLKFNDDVRLHDPDIHQPYAQVSGTFSVRVADVSRVRDDNGGKLADVKLAVVIPDECFANPVPLMGVRKGKFTPEAPVVFRFKGSDGLYTLDKLVH